MVENVTMEDGPKTLLPEESQRGAEPSSLCARDTCIIYIHGNQWDGVPARQRYLMEEMAAYADVYFIEEAEDRRWSVTWRQVDRHVWVIRGLMPMWVRFNRRRWTAAQCVSARIHLRRLRKSYRRIILWDAENWLRSYRFVPHDLFIYDCIDPCFSDDKRELDEFEDRDRELVKRADIVFASAGLLKEKCEADGRRVVLLNNACAPGEYCAELVNAAERPKWWPQTEQPVASYLGTIDARFDCDMAFHVCRELPEVAFVIAGQVLSAQERDVERLRSLENVVVPGRVSVEDGRYMFKHSSVGIIPFKAGDMNDAINPVKMYAYAYLGKMVVGTNVREIAGATAIAKAARDAQEFVEYIRIAIADRNDSAQAQRRRDFALENTWKQRAAGAWSEIEQCLGAL